MDATNANTALASALVEELARCGVRHAVLSPGSRSTPLAVALGRQPAIDLTVIVDERSAAFFALGAAQATRTPVAILCTSGTAAANFHPAVCEADESGVPLVVLTADRPPELRGVGAGQTIDQLKIYGDAVRWFCEVGTHDADDAGLLHYRAVACRAFAAARGEPRPGPVHLNLAWREPLAPVDQPDAITATEPLALEGRGVGPLTAVARSAPEADPTVLDELAEAISEAPNGLILAGRQNDPRLRGPLAELASAAGYPILAEPTSQLRLGPHDRSLLISAYDALARHERFRSRPPDIVVRFGDMPTSKPLRQWLASATGTRQVVVDPSSGWNEPTRHAQTLLRADPAATAEGLSWRLPRSAQQDWSLSWKWGDETARRAFASELRDVDAPSEPGLQLALGRLYRDGELVYTASSMPIRDQEAFLPPGGADVLFLCNRGANGIDGLISSGIGAAHASGRPTVIVTGDLGLLHDVGGLAALRDVSAPVRIVVVDNDGGGIFRFLPQSEAMPAEEFEQLLETPRGVDAGKAAELFNLPHQRIERLDQLHVALEAGTGVIEVPVDRAANVRLHARLNRAAEAALA